MPYEEVHEETRDKARKRKRNKRSLIILIALLAGIGFYFAYNKFQQLYAEDISDSKAHTYEAFPDQGETRGFDEVSFTFDTPKDWKALPRETVPFNKFSYESTKKYFEGRHLYIYMDSIPTDMPVNRALVVKAQGARLSHGEVSENCHSFAVDNSAGGKVNSSVIKARWNDVEFLCDNDAWTREVIGTTSTDGINKVTLTGPKSGTHSFFFVYNDQSANLDQTILYKVLESFKVK